jgi:serine protease inhibitor ecotin
MEWFDGRTTEDECLPLVFKNGKLTGWGWDYYEKERITYKFGK